MSEVNNNQNWKYVLEVRDLHTTFSTDKGGEVHAVNGVSFNLEPGKILGIVGESGSGKSVTAYSIMDILSENGSVTGGQILYKGEDITKWDEKKMQTFRGRCCSIIFQDPMTSLNPVYTIGNQLEEAILLHTQRNKQEARARAIEMLNLVGINEPEKRIKQYPYELSGGMRQRAAFARTLLTGSELLLLDEPFSALDFLTRINMQEWLLDQWESDHKTVLFITHDVEEAIFLSSRVLVVEEMPIRRLVSFDVPAAYPRTRACLTDPKMLALREQLIDLLRREVAE